MDDRSGRAHACVMRRFGIHGGVRGRSDARHRRVPAVFSVVMLFCPAAAYPDSGTWCLAETSPRHLDVVPTRTPRLEGAAARRGAEETRVSELPRGGEELSFEGGRFPRNYFAVYGVRPVIGRAFYPKKTGRA